MLPRHLGHALAQHFERRLDLARKARTHRFLQFGVALAHDLVHHRRLHAGRSQLREGRSRFYTVQLLLVPDQDDAAVRNVVAILSRSRICSVDASELSSTTTSVLV